MKILAGKFKGRPIARPKSESVRPMGDKVRAALFDIVGSVQNKIVLDAYAGSGAVGFEALSRGAASVLAIEQNSKVAAIIRQNAQGLGLTESHHLILDDVAHWLNTSNGQRLTSKVGRESLNTFDVQRLTFDVVVADPPYDQLDPAVLSLLGSRLTTDGILVVSRSSRIPAPELQSVKLIQSRLYGDSALSFYAFSRNQANR